MPSDHHHDTYVTDTLWEAMRDNLASTLLLPFEREDPARLEAAQDRAAEQMQALRLWPASIRPESAGEAATEAVAAIDPEDQEAAIDRYTAQLDALHAHSVAILANWKKSEPAPARTPVKLPPGYSFGQLHTPGLVEAVKRMSPGIHHQGGVIVIDLPEAG